MRKTYYQPELVATNDVPNGLFSFQVFPTREDCIEWMTRNGYLEDEYKIFEYHDEDIEDPTFLNGLGEDMRAVETEQDLDDAYLRLLKKVKGHFVSASPKYGPIEISPTAINETLGELYGVAGPGADKRLVVKALTEDFAICEGDFDIPYSSLEDTDSFERLLEAISFAEADKKVSAENPTPAQLLDGISNAMLITPADEELGVVVEDEEGEIRNITNMWYDKERGMLRLTIGETRFQDYKEW